jgi:hypothetical protein
MEFLDTDFLHLLTPLSCYLFEINTGLLATMQIMLSLLCVFPTQSYDNMACWWLVVCFGTFVFAELQVLLCAWQVVRSLQSRYSTAMRICFRTLL